MQQTFKQSEQTGKPKEKSTCEKSLVVLGIMPQQANTDLNKVKSCIQDKIKRDGLTWGESREEEIAYGIKKLVFGCVIEDKVSIEDVIEEIEKMEEVQAVDIITFNKV